MKSLRIKKLTQEGVLHHIIPIVAFVVLFGAIGAYFIFASHAATSKVSVIKTNYNGWCITAEGSAVKVEKCTGATDQRWALGGTIKDSATSKCLQYGGNSSGTKVTAAACGQAREGWNNTTKYSGLQASNGLCLAVPGGDTSANLEAVACNVKTYNSQNWTQTSIAPTGGSTGSGGGSGGGGGIAGIVAYAEGFQGVPYLFGGGHSEGFAAFKKHCPTPKASNSACEVDCSTLISYVVDAVAGTNWDWTVDGNGVMEGSGSGHWHAVSMSKLQPGDIVTTSDHVEFFVNYKSGGIETFGAHHTGTTDGFVFAQNGYYSKGYRYE